MVEMLRQQVQRSKDRVRDKENRCGCDMKCLLNLPVKIGARLTQ
jgi:hypothetical protein